MSRPKCPHGHAATLITREDIGPEWVQPVALDCPLCDADPDCERIPFKPGLPQGVDKLISDS